VNPRECLLHVNSIAFRSFEKSEKKKVSNSIVCCAKEKLTSQYTSGDNYVSSVKQQLESLFYESRMYVI